MADGKGILKDELSNDGLHLNSRGYQVMICGDHRRVISDRHLSKHGIDRDTTCWNIGSARITLLQVLPY
jgi:hypothetical protein